MRRAGMRSSRAALAHVGARVRRRRIAETRRADRPQSAADDNRALKPGVQVLQSTQRRICIKPPGVQNLR